MSILSGFLFIRFSEALLSVSSSGAKSCIDKFFSPGYLSISERVFSPERASPSADTISDTDPSDPKSAVVSLNALSV